MHGANFLARPEKLKRSACQVREELTIAQVDLYIAMDIGLPHPRTRLGACNLCAAQTKSMISVE